MRYKHRYITFLFLLPLAGVLTVCGGKSGSNAGPTTVNYSSLLTNLVENIAIPSAADFTNRTTSLQTATTEWCDRIEAGTTDATRTSIQASYKAAVLSWQALEVMQFGPLASNNNTRRYEIYAWPLHHACGVDREVVAARTSPYTLSTNTGRKGLSAVEYLIFDGDTDHACTSDDASVASWAGLDTATRLASRCGYLRLVVDDLVTRAGALETAWSEAKESFINSSADEGRASLNAVADALLYLDKEVKDVKLAQPAGISPACKRDSCPAETELVFSTYSREAIRKNVETFDGLMKGANGEGLNSVISESLAGSITSLTSEFLASITNNAPGKTLEELATGLLPNDCSLSTTSNRVAEICSLHKDLKKITDLLKGDFYEELKLDLPKRVAGDSD